MLTLGQVESPPDKSLENVTPANVYSGRAEAVLRRYEAIKRQPKEERRVRREAWEMERAALADGPSDGILLLGLR